MSLDDVELFFGKYVAWMRRDIEREIDWASAGRDAGNLLCTLGLVTYTEALGRVRRANLSPVAFRANDTETNFNEMFDRLRDGDYGRWRETEWKAKFPKASVYELLRCGLVHEYLPKVDAVIHMGPEQQRGVVVEASTLTVYVVPYYRDLVIEADRLLAELRNLQEPFVPPPHVKFPMSLNAISGVISVSGSSVASTGDPRAWPEDWRKGR